MFSYQTADLAPLLVSATLVGTGFTLSILSMQQHLGESSKPEDRSTVFSWFAMGVSVSGFVGPILSGIIIDAVSHRPAFLIPIISSIVALIFLCFGQKPKHKNSPPSKLRKGNNPFQLLRFTDLRDVLIVTGIISMCWDLQNFVIPIHGAQIGFSASKIGGIFGAFAVATFAIRIFMPTVRKFTTEWQVLLGTLGCVSCCFFLFPFVKSYAAFLGIALILGLGLGAAQPNIMTLVHTTAPHNRVAEALGLRLTVIHGNQVLLPIIFGAFGTALGTSAIFWTVTFIALAGVIFILRKEKHRR
jgi:MFS family permease